MKKWTKNEIRGGKGASVLAHYIGLGDRRQPSYFKPANEVKASESRLDAESGVADLLTDVMHFCDQAGEDFERLLDNARRNFEAERLDEVLAEEGLSVEEIAAIKAETATS